MSSSDRQAEDEAFEAAFHGLPDPKKRAVMSPEKLAILLSQQEVGSPAHILVEHELNLRIASIQSRATLKSGWLGLSGALFGTAVGFFLSTLSPKESPAPSAQVYRCECSHQSNRPVSSPKTPAASTVMQNGNPIDVQNGTGNTQTKQSYSPSKP